MKVFFKLLSSLVLLAGTVCAEPWNCEPRTEDYWFARHDYFTNYTKENAENIDVMFYGDSITDWWRYVALDIFDECYGPYGAVNYGIGGDRVEHLCYRMKNGELDAVQLNPEMIVLMIGVNNIFNGDSAADIFTGIQNLISLLLTRFDKTKILLLGVLPCCNGYFEYMCDINIYIAKLEDGHRVFFYDMFHHFAKSWNQIESQFYLNDTLHLDKPGYQKWSELMSKPFNQIMSMEDSN